MWQGNIFHWLRAIPFIKHLPTANTTKLKHPKPKSFPFTLQLLCKEKKQGFFECSPLRIATKLHKVTDIFWAWGLYMQSVVLISSTPCKCVIFPTDMEYIRAKIIIIKRMEEFGKQALHPGGKRPVWPFSTQSTKLLLETLCVMLKMWAETAMIFQGTEGDGMFSLYQPHRKSRIKKKEGELPPKDLFKNS